MPVGCIDPLLRCELGGVAVFDCTLDFDLGLKISNGEKRGRRRLGHVGGAMRMELATEEGDLTRVVSKRSIVKLMLIEMP